MMRKQLLMSTAALLAGLAVASAQQMPSGSSSGQSGAQQNEQRSGSQSQGRGGEQGRSGEMGEEGKKSGQAQRSEGREQGKQPSTTGQGQRERGQREEGQQQGQREQDRQVQPQRGDNQGKQQSKDQERSKQKSKTQAQGQDQGQAKQQGTTGQGQREPGKQRTQSKQGQPQSGTTGQGQSEPNQQGQAQPNRQGQTTQQNQPGQATQQNQTTQGQTGSTQTNASVQLNAQQQTRIRETIFARSDVPRVSRTDISVNVGAVVPSHIRVRPVDNVLLEIRPEWRGHQYFVVDDEIVIIDNSRRVVAMVPVGRQGADVRGSRSSSGSSSAMVAFEDLNAEEIREIQVALVNAGFDIGGAPDGKLGPKTRQALISFQQKNNIQANGRIDQRTVAQLNVNIRGMGGSSTTGQGGAQGGAQSGNNMQQPPANQGATGGNAQGNTPPANQGNPPANQGTTGQGGNASNPPVNNNGQPAGNMQNQPGGQSGSTNNAPARSRQPGNQPGTAR